jgi:chromosome segregation ATPase
MQQQLKHLREELKKEKRERSQAQQELERFKWRSYSGKSLFASGSRSKLELLEQELAKTKESETKLLESLTSQTKQLEQTKIGLEEAKLDIQSLNDAIKILEKTPVGALNNQLKLAVRAEEKSKKAMDGIALALQEVTNDSILAQKRLKATQLELEETEKENYNLRIVLTQKNRDLTIALEECDRLKVEADDSSLSWREKENGFLQCISLCEAEMFTIKEENEKLISSEKGARQEVYNLRDIIKHMINETSVAKESRDIALKENSQLKDLLKEKENTIQSLKHDLESIKFSEAAALDSVRKLKGLLVASSTMKSNKTAVKFEGESPRLPPKAVVCEGAPRVCKRNLTKSPLGHRWRNGRRYSCGDTEKIGCFSDIIGSPDGKEKDRLKSMDFEYKEEGCEAPGTPTRVMIKMKKNESIRKKFEGFLRWRSFQE